MNKKSLSPFGFMIELLDVPVTEIAGRIYVTQSLVSKWKSGVRSLKKSSEYFGEVVEYFIEQNQKGGQKTLENLFASLYTQEDADSPDYLRVCMSRFLSNEDVPPTARSLFYETKKNLYTSTLSVFIGKEGRKSAFSMMLDAAESVGNGEIILLEREQFSWLLDDPEYMEQWREQMLRILDMGCRLHIVHFISFGSLNTFTFMREFHAVVFHKNTQEYYFHYYSESDCVYSHYLLKGQLSIMGLNPGEKDEQMYTAVYRDPFTLLQHEKLCEKIIGSCTSLYKIYSGNHIQLVLDKIKSYEKKEEDIYFSNFTPEFITMDEELFGQVLEGNGVVGKARNRCMGFYRAVSRVITDRRSWHFHSAQSIRRCLSLEEVPYYALSEIAERPVHLTAAQFRRHLQNVADLLGANRHFHVTLSTFDDELIEAASLWCKENLWSLSFDNAKMGLAKFGEEPVVVNAISYLLRKQWENQLPQYRENDPVAKLMQAFAREETP